LRVRDILKPKDEKGQIGAGMIGMLSNKKDSLEFIKTVKEKFNSGGVRYTKPIKDKVEKIAVCGGSGSFLLQDAIKANADVFITSDFTYHQFFDAEDKIMIIDIGHYEFEQFTKNLIDKLLHPLTRDEKIEFLISETNTNPVNYM
jgi:putative NIF3 family GTP cyclohydrolase 1 type 2